MGFEDEARRDLESILEAIRRECGLVVAVKVAEVVRQGIRSGAVNGAQYGPVTQVFHDGTVHEGPTGHCIIGWIGVGLDCETDNWAMPLHVPGWSTRTDRDPNAEYNIGEPTPIEDYMISVRPGQTEATCTELANMGRWLDEWLAQPRRGDARVYLPPT